MLYQHQIDGIRRLKQEKRIILADQQGLGKTIQAIMAAESPVLVVCPASVKTNWQREILKWTQEEAFILPNNNPDIPAGWVIINYDILAKHYDDLKSVGFKTIILDESHYIKNAKSKRTISILGGKIRTRKGGNVVDEKSVDGLLSNFDGNVFLLSGTPIENRPAELYTQLQAIRHPLGNNWFKYHVHYCDAYHGRFGWVLTGASHLDELSEELGDQYLRRTKEQVLDLPPKIITKLEQDFPERQKEQEDLSLGEDWQTMVGALSKRKLANAILKIPTTLEIIFNLLEDPLNKILVFSDHVEPIITISKKLGSKAVILVGETSQKQRVQSVDLFQQSAKVQCFCATYKAGGVGLNLTAAQYVVLVDPPWVPSTVEQACDRAHRIGQQGTVNIIANIWNGSEVENAILNLLAKKSEIIKQIHSGIETRYEDQSGYIKQRIKRNAKNNK